MALSQALPRGLGSFLGRGSAALSQTGALASSSQKGRNTFGEATGSLRQTVLINVARVIDAATQRPWRRERVQLAYNTLLSVCMGADSVGDVESYVNSQVGRVLYALFGLQPEGAGRSATTGRGKPPLNASDLCALSTCRLSALQRETRTGSSRQQHSR